MHVLTANEMECISGGNVFVESTTYYVASEVGAAFLEGAELGSIAGPGGALIGGLAALGAAAIWEATK